VSKAEASAEEVCNLEADLAYKFLRAPISGVLGDINPEESDTLVTVTVNDRLWIRLDAPSTLGCRLPSGMRGWICWHQASRRCVRAAPCPS